jgi:DNA-binding response OmpR family regulator
MANRILVVDDEKSIVKGLRFSLEQDGMLVDTAYDGEEALRLAKANEYSLILLDWMIPKINGLDVSKVIREFSSVPIIMVTAKGEDIDVITGLEYADDYLVKPFNILELKARIRTVLRRTSKVEKSSRVRIRDIEIDFIRRTVFVNGSEVSLTAKEFDLLEMFAESQGKVHTREALLNSVWGFDSPCDGRTVDVHVRRLREKIEKNPSDPRYIKTKWGVGYYFD